MIGHLIVGRGKATRLPQQVSLDTETTLIDEECHWLAPIYVLGAVFDGERGYFLTRDHVEEFLRLHLDVILVMHNAAFDLDVLQQMAPTLDIYECVERDQVWDTYLLHRLCRLATLVTHPFSDTLEPVPENVCPELLRRVWPNREKIN